MKSLITAVVFTCAGLASLASANIDLTGRYIEHTMAWNYGYAGDARSDSDHQLIDTLMTDTGSLYGHSSGIVDTLADQGNWFGHDWTVAAQYGSSSNIQNYLVTYNNYPHDLDAMSMWGQSHSTTTETGGALSQLTTSGLTRYEFSVTGSAPTPVQLIGTLTASGAQAEATTRLDFFGPFGWQAMAIWNSAITASFDQTFMLDPGQLYRVEMFSTARDVGASPGSAAWELIIDDLSVVAPEPASLSLIAGLMCVGGRRRR